MLVNKITLHHSFLKLHIFFSLLSINIYSNSPPDTSEINVLFYKAVKMGSTNLDSSLILAKKGFMLSQKINYEKGIAMALMRFGSVFNAREKNDSALLFLRQALSIRHKLKLYGEEGNTANLISAVFSKKGNKDSAFHYLYLALDLYEKIDDSLNIGEIYHRLAEAFIKYGNQKEALKQLKKSLTIFTTAGDSFYVSRTYKLYGMFYFSKLENDSALYYFKKAAQIDEKLNNEYEIATDFNYLGLCYEAANNSNLSKFCFQKALSLYSKFNLPNYMAEVQYNLGFYFYKRERYDSSIYYFEKANETLKNAGLEDLNLKIYLGLSECYSLKGNYLKAYEYHVKYSDLNDSLLDNEKVKQIAEMQTKYETEKKEQQISLLDQQNKTKTAQRNALIAGSVVLLILFLASGVYFIQRNRIAKKNEQIAREEISGLLKEQEIKSYNAMIEGQEEERKRIATDLHDRLGSMLSTVKLLFNSLEEKIDKNQDENRGQYNKATGLLDEAVLEVRRISHNLSTGMVNTFGLVPALEELCQSIDNSKIIKCKLLCYGMEARLDQQTEIGLFRIVQELVNNVLKHADAKLVTIQLNRTSESLNLTVEDDGKGFDVEEKKKSNGMGLKNLEARAAKLNGVYYVDSKPGRGTISIIEVPLNHDSNTYSGRPSDVY